MSELEFFLDDKDNAAPKPSASCPAASLKPADAGKLYDLAILGAGPAGMTAAVYASRKMLDAVLITKDIGGQPLLTAKIENYMGYQYISGKSLIEKFDEQVRKFPIAVVENDGAASIKKEPDGFSVATESGKNFRARSLVITSGKRSRELGVPGERKLVGKGVAYCSTCDAPLFGGKDVVVVGGGNSALTAVNDLLKVARKIYLVNNLPELTGDPVLRGKVETPKVEKIMPASISEIVGENTVEAVSVRTSDGNLRRIEAQGIFIEIGLEPNSAFADGLPELNSSGEIKVDCRSRTSVEGIFAAGDVTDVPEKQIIVAAGEGAKAALGAYRYLVGLKK
ncbi:MAG: thioredoxin-disulfide reductase [Elusimicrobia bacterium HGW-Elusimicrobia-1]|jgi:alkyl hydroperoxide reductase subunit F|nr:MAG: thioredoxin-disulfide reductase [Elusimicrobia bacterium HGW-Elusimicrobia-1]